MNLFIDTSAFLRCWIRMTTIIGAPRELGGKFLKMGCGESGLYFRRSFSRAGFRHIAIDSIKYLNKYVDF
jgi:hypothetical protein